jgi:hypothetical protein
MKTIAVLSILFLSAFCLSQNQFKIFLGSGFMNDHVTMTGTYYVGDEKHEETLLANEELTSNHVIGLAKSVNANFSKKSYYELLIKIEDRTYFFKIDKLTKKSELKIDKVHDLDIHFKFKGGFSFY